MAVQVTSDALALESTFIQEITLAELGVVAALEPRELVGAIAVKGSRLKTTPIITILLGVGALIVRVARA
jgi:hypothetical protein